MADTVRKPIAQRTLPSGRCGRELPTPGVADIERFTDAREEPIRDALPSVCADDEVRVEVWPLALYIGVFLGHPAKSLIARVLPVARQSAAQPFRSRGLDPDRQGEVFAERVA